MVAQGCVNCHNAHPDTPKNDWKLGDVRGVLEVTKNIDAQLISGQNLGNLMSLILFAMGAVLVTITIIVSRNVARKVSDITIVMMQLSN